MIDYDYNDRNLWAFIHAMSLKERTKVLRSTFRRSANEIKRRAGEILLTKLRDVRDPKAMKRMIWTKVYTKTAGFRVTVAGDRYYYPSRMKNKQGGVRELPLARWIATGTPMPGKPERRTDRGYYRGELPQIDFLGQARNELEARVMDEIEDRFLEQAMREAQKYGCI